jgi:hypothetical protein
MRAKQTFACADRGLGRVANDAQGFGVKRFSLQPHQVIGFQGACQFHRAAQFEGEAHIERDAHIRPKLFAENANHKLGIAQNRRGTISGVVVHAVEQRLCVGVILEF